jgi:hypothetical protein
MKVDWTQDDLEAACKTAELDVGSPNYWGEIQLIVRDGGQPSNKLLIENLLRYARLTQSNVPEIIPPHALLALIRGLTGDRPKGHPRGHDQRYYDKCWKRVREKQAKCGITEYAAIKAICAEDPDFPEYRVLTRYASTEY